MKQEYKEFLIIPYELLEYNITPLSKILYGLLYKETKQGNNPTQISYKRLSEILDTTTRTIYRALEELKNNNLIQINKMIDTKKYIITNRVKPKPIKNIQEFYRRIR